MKLKKIAIHKKIIDINFKFYLFIKELNSTTIKLNNTDINNFMEAYFSNQNLGFEKLRDIFQNIVHKIKSFQKKSALELLLLEITNELELQSFIFGIKLLKIKDLLLEEAKLIEVISLPMLQDINQLSLKYDSILKSRPYYIRANGALLVLLFFDKLDKKDTSFISESSERYINSLMQEYSLLTSNGLEANQMFMLMFTESVNQSIKSEAGSSYEDRIYNVLIGMGISSNEIKKMHDPNDTSTEFDFYFKLNDKTIGIGAKRTLRERYKQFIKTVQMSQIDLMIQITLGLDLTEKKAASILKHGVIIFIADEIYASRSYFEKMNGIYPASMLSIDLLKKLTNY